jgi:hypothetical protein
MGCSSDPACVFPPEPGGECTYHRLMSEPPAPDQLPPPVRDPSKRWCLYPGCPVICGSDQRTSGLCVSHSRQYRAYRWERKQMPDLLTPGEWAVWHAGIYADLLNVTKQMRRAFVRNNYMRRTAGLPEYSLTEYLSACYGRRRSPETKQRDSQDG